jgi:hypothetical protein
MSWYLRADEQQDGSWVCRFGSQQFGTLPTRTLALHLLAEAATLLGGREIFSFYLHHVDGKVEARPASDPVPGEMSA